MSLLTILHSGITKGAVSGCLGAAAVDFQAFRSWKSFHDAATYQWGVAVWRWVQGAVVGGVTAAGYGAIA
jgi:hypothetical protein